MTERTSRLPAPTSLAGDRTWLAAIVESSDDAILGKTLDGVVTSWNPGAERLYGYSAEEMLGQSIALLVPPDRPDELPGILERLRRGERVDHYETVRVRKDQRRIHVSVTISPIREPNGAIVGASAIARDVTERTWSDLLLAGERQVFEMVALGMPFTDVLEYFMRTVEALAGDGLVASILLLDADGLHLRHGAAPNLPDAYNRAIDGVAIGPSVGSCGTAAYRREPVIVADIAADPLWDGYRELAQRHRLGACWSTPIIGPDDQVLGTFALYYHESRAPSPAHLRLAQLVSRTAAIIIERKRAEEARARLTAIVASSDDAILGKTLEGVVTSWNPGAERLYGYPAEAMLGQSLVRIVPPERRDEYDAVMAQVRRGTHVPAFDTVRLHQDGHPVDVSVSLSPVRDERGTVTAISAIARDIAERRALERLQQDFLAMVTHELRNPLAGVKGFAQLLKRRATYDERAVDTILDQAGVLDRLINDLLDASRVQIGQLELERGVMDLVAEARACADQVQAQTTAHTIRVEAPDRPLEGAWDRTRLGQVFANLLSNAVKYSPAGGEVLVRVEAGRTEALVSIRDQGRGIASDQVPRLFERFYRVDRGGAARSLGLGLYITRGIVESHGGRIWAESDGEGQGSTFTFTLPYGEPPDDPTT